MTPEPPCPSLPRRLHALGKGDGSEGLWVILHPFPPVREKEPSSLVAVTFWLSRVGRARREVWVVGGGGGWWAAAHAASGTGADAGGGARKWRAEVQQR